MEWGLAITTQTVRENITECMSAMVNHYSIELYYKEISGKWPILLHSVWKRNVYEPHGLEY